MFYIYSNIIIILRKQIDCYNDGQKKWKKKKKINFPVLLWLSKQPLFAPCK